MTQEETDRIRVEAIHEFVERNKKFEKKYLPTFAELIDRLSICILKRIFIPQNSKEYAKEIELIKHDIDLDIGEYDNAPYMYINADMIEAMLIIMLSNRYIWENESKAREGKVQDLTLLRKTHAVNGVRNTAKNLISKEMNNDRIDLKVDCIAAGIFNTEKENWDIFKKENE